MVARGHAACVRCGDDPNSMGEAAAALRARGQRVAIWVGPPDTDAIIEMVNELFTPSADEHVR